MQEATRTGKVSILLVDDQPARLMSYESILEPLNQNLVCARSGSEALEQLMSREFALILLDVSMPGMDGFETAAMIHDHPRFERTPIIFVTGVHDTEFDRLKGYKLGAVDYVSIPIVPEILRGKVSVLIELHCKRRDLQDLNQSLAAANRQLADANVTLQAEKARELEALNADLQLTNRELEQSNAALQAQVTERIRIEAALKEADRRKDEFLAILAHELRNPLAALSAAARLLGRQPQKPEIAAMACEALQRQVTHMARLLDDLLDVSRISHELMQLRMECMNAVEIVHAAVEMVRPQLDAKGQTLNLDLGVAEAFVAADAVRLSQIVGNLLNNSVKYTPAGGRIDVSVSATEEALHISVRDNGIGIDSSMLEHVFEMFSRAGRTAQDSQGGLGIGLALVKGLVGLHKGGIRVLSEGEGCGSEFIVTLPLLRQQVDRMAAPTIESPQEAMRPLRVLVADDNVDSAMSWSALLEACGHEVFTAYDGLAAVEKAERFRPQIALLDIGMPSLDGYEVARRIRATRPGQEMFLVAITGWGQAKDRALAHAAGFDEYFTKPVDSAQIERALYDAIRKLDAASPNPAAADPAVGGMGQYRTTVGG